MAKMTKSQKKVGRVMREFKGGKLHSGSKKGPLVKSRKQAIAIALSEAGISKPRKFAEGGAVDIAAPPVGTTDLSGTVSSQAQQQPQIQQQGPYSSSMDYGMGAGSTGTMSYQPSGQNLTVRNRMGGNVGILGTPQGYAKGGLVTARGVGKARKTKPCKIC